MAMQCDMESSSASPAAEPGSASSSANFESLLPQVEQYLESCHKGSWHTTLNSHVSTCPKTLGGPIVRSVTQCQTFTPPGSASGTWRCVLDLPNSFEPGDGLRLVTEIEAVTKDATSEQACRRAFSRLLMGRPEMVVLQPTHWKVSLDELLVNISLPGMPHQALPVHVNEASEFRRQIGVLQGQLADMRAEIASVRAAAAAAAATAATARALQDALRGAAVQVNGLGTGASATNGYIRRRHMTPPKSALPAKAARASLLRDAGTVAEAARPLIPAAKPAPASLLRPKHPGLAPVSRPPPAVPKPVAVWRLGPWPMRDALPPPGPPVSIVVSSMSSDSDDDL